MFEELVEALMKLVELLWPAEERSFGIMLKGQAEREAARQLVLLYEHLVRAGRTPPRSTPDALIGTVRTFETASRTGYQPEAKYPVPVHLVLLANTRINDETNQETFVNAVRDWRTWAPDRDVWHGPRDHMTGREIPPRHSPS